MVHTRLFFSQVVVQIVIGTLVPIVAACGDPAVQRSEKSRRIIYAISGCLTMIGIFAMRWNVVIGGQLFSKSFLGYTTYKVDLITREGELLSALLLILPFAILAVLVKILSPWPAQEPVATEAGASAASAR